MDRTSLLGPFFGTSPTQTQTNNNRQDAARTRLFHRVMNAFQPTSRDLQRICSQASRRPVVAGGIAAMLGAASIAVIASNTAHERDFTPVDPTRLNHHYNGWD